MNSLGSMDFIDIIFLVTCAYVFICGIIGKGKIYDDATIHSTRRDDYFKAVRIFSLAGGAVGIASVVIGKLGYQIASIVLGFVFFASIIALIVVIWPMNKDRIKRAQEKDQNNGKG